MGIQTDQKFAAISWNVMDVLDLRPEWSEDQALAFLIEHETTLRDMTIQKGNEVIEDLLAQEKD
jgi:hypothetical protein